MSYAKIELELYKSGMRVSCEDTGDETFIPRGNGNALMDFINNVDEICDPEATFVITEKGLKYLEELEKQRKLCNG
jgi:hypothetical protein